MTPQPWEPRDITRRYLIDDVEALARRQRPHPVLDKLVAAALIFGALVTFSAATYVGNLALIVALWGLLGWGHYWLWAQYREHTRPHALSPPAPPTARPHLPLAVRLMLLPGAHRLVGQTNVNKARRIRFLRTDMARRALADRDAADRSGMDYARKPPYHNHTDWTHDPTCPACIRQAGRTLPGHSRHGWM